MTSYATLLREELAELLGMDAAALSDSTNFSDLGVDSLVGLRFIRRVQEAIGREVDFEWMFDYPTIGQLSTFLDSQFNRGAPVGSTLASV